MEASGHALPGRCYEMLVGIIRSDHLYINDHAFSK